KLLAIGMISEYLQSAGLIHVSFYRTEAIEPFRRISGDSSTLWKILPPERSNRYKLERIAKELGDFFNVD
ncbi:MAG: hypothetical protein Q7R97_01725, partial [Candidatus Daviesbacteria bacterium]|nr:hypothetical protein [Candidatus Daviesbacteria bacterium]